MELSIIIVNWNSTSVLKECLNSINKHVVGIKHEVVVADNNSDDVEPEMLYKEYPEVKFIFNKRNLGYSKANNQCAEEGSGEFLLFLNPDIILTANTVDSMLNFLKAEKNAGAVSGRFLNPDGSLQRFYRKFPTISYIISYATIVGRIAPSNRFANEYQYNQENFETITKVDQPGTSLFMIRREFFRELQGFDENMPIFFNDADLCRRIKKRDYDIYVLPEARVYHRQGESVKKEKPEIIILEGALSLFEYFRKHRSLFYASMSKGIIIIDQIARFFYGLILHMLGRRSGEKYLYRAKVVFCLIFNKRLISYG